MTNVSITKSLVEVTKSSTTAVIDVNVGGTGPRGITGPQGPSGTVAVTSPITLSGSSTNATIGINQSSIAIGPSQVTGVAVVKAPTSSQTITNSTSGAVPLSISQFASNHALQTTLSATSGNDITALNVVSSNPDSSSMWLSGKEYGHGTLKVAHVQPSVTNAQVTGLTIKTDGTTTAVLNNTTGLTALTTYEISSTNIPIANNISFTTSDPVNVNITLSSNTGVTSSSGSFNTATIYKSDANASAISINLANDPSRDSTDKTAVQGIYMDTYQATDNSKRYGTTGNLLNLKNAGNQKLVLNSDGQLQLFQGGGTGGIKLYSSTGTSGTVGNIYMSSDNTVSIQNAALYARPNVAAGATGTAFYVGSSSVGVGPTKSAFTINIDGKLSWGIENPSNWVTGTSYLVGDYVVATPTGGSPGIYRCTVAHTASSSFDSDLAKWYKNAVNSSQDTYLYRGSVNELKTDNNFTVVGNLQMGLNGDANLYRSAASTLKTDGNVNISGNLNLGSTGDTVLYRSSSDTIRTNNLLYIYRDPTSYGLAIANTTTSGPTCFAIRGDGRIEWGPGGGASRDTFLYRATNGGLQVGSAISFPYIAKSTNFDMTSDYVNYYTVDCTAAITVTLPDASVVGTGRVYKIKSSVSGTVTVNAASGQLIDGTSSKTITTQYSFLTVQSTGSKWITI